MKDLITGMKVRRELVYVPEASGEYYAKITVKDKSVIIEWLDEFPQDNEELWKAAINEADKQYQPTGVHPASQVLNYLREHYSITKKEQK